LRRTQRTVFAIGMLAGYCGTLCTPMSANFNPVPAALRITLQAPENALRMFKFGSHIRARLVWFNPDAATPAEDDEAA
jgi:hypothetical protein